MVNREREKGKRIKTENEMVKREGEK